MTSPIPNESFLQWDPAQVSNYIGSLLPEDQVLASSKFLDQNIEGSLLPFITTQHLKELGINNLSTRLQIKKSITELITNHYNKYPPSSLSDPEYKLNNVNINNNYVSLESLTLSTVLIKDMFKKLTHSVQQQQQASIDSSPVLPSQQQIDIRKLNDNFTKLKTDLIPVIRLLKDSKPLPTPTLDPGPASNLNVGSPTYSVLSTQSNNSLEPIQDAPNASHLSVNNNSNINNINNSNNSKHDITRSNSVSTTQAFSNSNGGTLNQQPASRASGLPSPTYSHRFSLGSLLSMGTGKIIQQSISKSDSMHANSISQRNFSRPKLIESKSATSATGIQGFQHNHNMVNDEDINALTNSVYNNENNSTNTDHLTVSQPSNRPILKLGHSLSSTNTISNTGTLSSPDAKHNHASVPQLHNHLSQPHLNQHHQQSQQSQPHTQAPPSNEPLKQLRASSEDSCRKILTQAMKRHHIPEHDWSKYVLVICYGDKERILKLEERPVIIFKELQELGKHPAIMLRMLANMNDNDDDNDNEELYNDSRIGDDIPGGTL